MKFPKETHDLKYFVLLMKWSGFWLGKKDSKTTLNLRLFQRLRVLVAVLQIVLWDLSWFLLYQVENDKMFSKSYTGILIIANYTLPFILYFYSKYDDMEDFVEGMKSLTANMTEKWEMEIYDRITGKLLKYMSIYFINILLFVFMSYFFPIVIDLILAMFSNSSEPYFYLPIPLEGLIEIKRSFLFYFVQLVNILFEINICLYYFGLYNALTTTVAYLSVEFKLLRRKLQIWSEVSQGIPRSDYFRQILRDHNQVIRLSKIMKTLVAPFHNTQNMISTVSLPFLLHSTLRNYSGGNTLLFLGDLYASIMMEILSLIACYVGEMIKTESVKLLDTLNTIKWYEEKPAIRRNLVMVLVAALKPVEIDFYNDVGLNLETYSNLLSSSYSMFMLLEASL